MSARIKPTHVALLIFVCSAYLGLVRLDNTYFWDDEAEGGIISRNFLTTGQLTGWDGRNLYGYRDGRLLDEQLHIRNPPLHYWLTAASFKVFGISTWAGRFPSVLLGLTALALLPLSLRANLKQDWTVTLYGMAALGLSVPFLLYIRQCRYYALAVSLSALAFYAYQRCRDARRIHNFLLLAAAAVLLFYTNYLTGTAFLLGLAVVHVVCYRKEFTKGGWLLLLLAAGVFAFATVPHAVSSRIWFRPEVMSQAGGTGGEPSWSARKLTLLWWNLRDINLIGSMPWVVSAGILFLLLRRRNEEIVTRLVWPWTVLALGYVFFLAMLSHQPTKDNVGADVRYLVPLLPFFAGLTGALLSYLHRRSRIIALLAFMLMISTDLLAAAPFNITFRWLLPAYILEVHHEYPTCYRAVSEFLETNAKQDDLVLAHPDFCNYPLMFYAGQKVRFCCLLDKQTLLPRDIIDKLDAPLFREANFPDWLILFGAQETANPLLTDFTRPHAEKGLQVQFRYELATNLNVFWMDTSRPELHWHTFGPYKDFNVQSNSVYVLRRTKVTNGEAF